jgi:steroid delta-isomerase-like uncharacterized protein
VQPLCVCPPPSALGVGAEVEDEGEDDDEPLEALDPVRGTPHHRVGEGRPGQQEEADEGDEPALEGAAEQVAEKEQGEERQSWREQGEEDDEATDVVTLPARSARIQVRSKPMSADANKDLVRRFYREAINERDSSACGRLLSEDFVHNGEARGRTGQRQAVDYFLAAFPDLSNEIELILAEDGLVAAHQRWRGTHGGEFLGVEASGNRVEFTSTAVLRIRDGLISRAWDEMDSGAILQQLGNGG